MTSGMNVEEISRNHSKAIKLQGANLAFSCISVIREMSQDLNLYEQFQYNNSSVA